MWCDPSVFKGQKQVAGRLDGGREETVGGYIFSSRGDENVLNSDIGDGCTTVVYSEIDNKTQNYTLQSAGIYYKRGIDH